VGCGHRYTASALQELQPLGGSWNKEEEAGGPGGMRILNRGVGPGELEAESGAEGGRGWRCQGGEEEVVRDALLLVELPHRGAAGADVSGHTGGGREGAARGRGGSGRRPAGLRPRPKAPLQGTCTRLEKKSHGDKGRSVLPSCYRATCTCLFLYILHINIMWRMASQCESGSLAT